MIKKLKSRKFLITLLTDIMAIATMFINNDNQLIQIISIIVMAISNIIYAIIEGNIDAKSVVGIIKNTTNEIDKRLDDVENNK